MCSNKHKILKDSKMLTLLMEDVGNSPIEAKKANDKAYFQFDLHFLLKQVVICIIYDYEGIFVDKMVGGFSTALKLMEEWNLLGFDKQIYNYWEIAEQMTKDFEKGHPNLGENHD